MIDFAMCDERVDLRKICYELNWKRCNSFTECVKKQYALLSCRRIVSTRSVVGGLIVPIGGD